MSLDAQLASLQVYGISMCELRVDFIQPALGTGPWAGLVSHSSQLCKAAFFTFYK